MSAISDDEIVVGTGPRPATAQSDEAPKPKYKSWRKKFRKMKVHFDESIKANSNMYKEENKLENLARRLRESNDQLLDLLLDLNSSLMLPPQERFDVRWRDSWVDRGDKVDIHEANRILADAYELDDRGRRPHATSAGVRASLETHLAGEESQSLAALEANVPQLAYSLDDPEFRQSLNDFADPVAYYPADNEEEYLRRVDADLGEPPLIPSHDKEPPSPTSFSTMTAREAEREVELRNPQSVHNWLKRHNVSISESDDKSDNTSSKKPTSRNLAKKVGDRSVELAMERDGGSPIGSVVGSKHDLELGDDENDASNKRRRSRDADDSTYRPKGGKGGSKPKRKREDGESIGGSKKPKTSISGMSDA